MKAFIALIFSLFVLAAVAPPVVQAQIGPGRLHVFATDTTAQSETINFQFPKDLDDGYKYTWQVDATRISDTTAISVVIDERVNTSGQWYPLDTLTFAGGSGYAISKYSSGLSTGRQQRARAVVTNGVTQLVVAVWYRREKD